MPSANVILCALVVVGGVLVAIGGIMVASAPGQEVDVWYNVPLCPETMSGGQASSGRFVSRDLSLFQTASSLASICSDSSSPEQVTFTVPTAGFVEKIDYIAFTMRSTGTVLWPTEGNNTGAFLDISMDGKFATSSADASASRRLSAAGAPVEGRGSGRRLLKGGGGSYSRGSTFRSRYSSYNRWGRGTVTRRRYTVSGPAAMGAGTTVVVYSRVPIMGTRSAAGYKSVYSSKCSSNAGCDYTIPAAMTKDEWRNSTFKIKAGQEMTLRVTAALRYDAILNSSTAAYPSLFVGFVTNAEIPGTSTGVLLLMIGVVTIFVGGFIVQKQRANITKYCDRNRGGAGYTQVGTDAPAGSAVSIVAMPQPSAPAVAAGPSFIRRNGDLRRISQIRGNYSLVDVYSNDITVLDGCEALTSMQILNVSENDLQSLNGLFSESLISFSATNNDLVAIAGLSQARNLQVATLDNNDISRLTDIGHMPQLRYLNLQSNNLKSLAGIQGCPQLTHLDVANNDITDLTGLAELRQLQCVNLAQNDIEDPTAILALAFCPDIQWINIQGNNMRAVSIQQVRDAFADKPNVTLLS